MISKKNMFKAIVVLLLFSVLISAYVLYPKLNSNKFDVQQPPLSVLSINEKLKSDNFSVQQANVQQSAYQSTYTSIDSLIGNPDLQCPDCNVFLIVIDTLRPDHLGVYGYDKNTSPNIDALAEKSFLFTHAFAHSSWTRPSVASILTGMYPAQHGANSMSDKLRNESVTLQEILSENGYTTAGFIANFQIERQFGFDQGFDLYDDRDDYNIPAGVKLANCTSNKTTPWLQRCKVGDKYMFFRQGNNNRTAEEINIAFFKWFDKNKDKKMFVYLHYNDPHEPYSPPMPYTKMFFSNNYTAKIPRVAGALPLYDGEIAYTDFWIGELIKRLKDEGIYEKSIVVLMADHGEEFAEHNGFGHFRTLYDEVIKIPLMIHTPTTTGKNIIDKQTESIEVPRYILHLLNIYPKNQSNFQFTVNKEYKDMSYSYLKHEGPWGTELISVRTPQYKYIYNATGDQAVLFAVSDPTERDILQEEPEVVKEMSEYLDWINGLPRITPIKINLSKETKQQLKALGYMN